MFFVRSKKNEGKKKKKKKNVDFLYPERSTIARRSSLFWEPFVSLRVFLFARVKFGRESKYRSAYEFTVKDNLKSEPFAEERKEQGG